MVGQCPVTPTEKKITDCKAIKNHVKEGDVVLRSTPGAESDLIRKASRCDYSHTGIVCKNAAGELVVVDAYPDRTGGDVKEESVDDFFCEHDTFKGLVARPKDCELGEKAAEWAMEQTKDPTYRFDIFDSADRNPKQLYCSDFVYQAYSNPEVDPETEVDLVPEKMDFLSQDNKKNTLEAVREYAKSGANTGEKLAGKWASDDKLEAEFRKRTGSPRYITPCQVAVNEHMDTIVDFESSSP